MEEHLPSVYEALSLILALQKMKMKEEKKSHQPFKSPCFVLLVFSCFFPFMPQLCTVAFKKLIRKQASEMFTGKVA